MTAASSASTTTPNFINGKTFRRLLLSRNLFTTTVSVEGTLSWYKYSHKWLRNVRSVTSGEHPPPTEGYVVVLVGRVWAIWWTPTPPNASIIIICWIGLTLVVISVTRNEEMLLLQWIFRADGITPCQARRMVLGPLPTKRRTCNIVDSLYECISTCFDTRRSIDALL